MTTIKSKRFVLNDDGSLSEFEEDLNLEVLQSNGVSNEQPPKEYSLNRMKEYPTIQEQLDMLYHLGYDGWKSEINKIKQKYPKENT